MTSRKLEVNLSPQNEEWINLIPNLIQNGDIVFNKLIDMAINEGLFLEVISQSLTVSDLSKFKNAYSRIQAKRSAHMAELETTPLYTERKKSSNNDTFEGEEEIILEETKTLHHKKPEKKMTHGFDEETF